jgi:ER-bound oxygenase mpaB/B'/Rubber oxygenase, catalytic domain
MHRYEWRRRIEQLDPVADYHEIYRIMVAHEFPWDMNQALSFALFRTYAVPSIGGLLARTGEFLEHAQQRYDDTTLILDAVVEHGFGSVPARDAFRRMNQMHGAYRIDNDDLRYVLSTFVVVPMCWMNSYGWRPFTETEKVASANYYRRLGAHMNIKSVPVTYHDFIALADAYEREHFGFDEGGRAVAESTLKLLATFPPSDRLPSSLVRRASYALMDDPLLASFGFPRPNPVVRALVRLGLTARGRAVRFLPPRTEPRYARQLPNLRSYPDGYDIAQLGTFPTGGHAD